jgi:hypothetical protein
MVLGTKFGVKDNLRVRRSEGCEALKLLHSLQQKEMPKIIFRTFMEFILEEDIFQKKERSLNQKNTYCIIFS